MAMTTPKPIWMSLAALAIVVGCAEGGTFGVPQHYSGYLDSTLNYADGGGRSSSSN
jgi:hypothetical protein